MIPCCADCTHFEPPPPPGKGGRPKQEFGECHRYPPKAGAFALREKWPLPERSDWCGEFEGMKIEK